MSVNLRRFVNIDIQRAKRNPVNPVRDTIALMNVTLQDGLADGDILVAGTLSKDANGNQKYIVTKSDGIEITLNDVTTTLCKYIRRFFDNNGIKLHLYTAEFTAANITALPRNEIGIAKAGGLTEGDVAEIKTYNGMANPSPSNEEGTTNATGSSAKIFFTNIAKASLATYGVFDAPNICIKYGTPGMEMLPAAYLSKINAYGVNTIHDYAFTIEVVDAANASTLPESEDDNISQNDATVAECMSHFINVDTVLANQIRNVGGDLAQGDDLVNAYFTIVLQQTLEDAAVNALSEKLSGADGTAKIYNVIIAELNKYVRSGLISAGNWQNEDWIENYNGDNFLVVSANERLVTGYKVYVVPFAAMTSTDVASHKCPPIYIAMTNAYGIRKITIAGEVM